mmetsp:Transcript_26520/g.65860  ORF Transcript_26520/g.65860 Transcript_26520/m.65860 type:complete len:112 (-) Transcript_26520:232-567(-)
MAARRTSPMTGQLRGLTQALRHEQMPLADDGGFSRGREGAQAGTLLGPATVRQWRPSSLSRINILPSFSCFEAKHELREASWCDPGKSGRRDGDERRAFHPLLKTVEPSMG